jgi:hypothetical protein
MGTPGTYEGTYFGMLDHNITTVARALGGSAPEAGFLGKLTGKSGETRLGMTSGIRFLKEGGDGAIDILKSPLRPLGIKPYE